MKATGPDCEGCLDAAAVLHKASESGLQLQDLWGIPEQVELISNLGSSTVRGLNFG